MAALAQATPSAQPVGIDFDLLPEFFNGIGPPATSGDVCFRAGVGSKRTSAAPNPSAPLSRPSPRRCPDTATTRPALRRAGVARRLPSALSRHCRSRSRCSMGHCLRSTCPRTRRSHRSRNVEFCGRANFSRHRSRPTNVGRFRPGDACRDNTAAKVPHLLILLER
jgi:hypothetical protein